MMYLAVFYFIFSEIDMETHELHTAELDIGQQTAIRIRCLDSNNIALSGRIGTSISIPQCDPEVQKDESSVTLTWKDFGKLVFSHSRLVR